MFVLPKLLTKLQYLLSEKGKFDSYPIHSLGFPLMAVSLLM